MRPAALAALAVAAAACGPLPARDFGAQLFSDPAFSGSAFNAWSCATCHATGTDEARLLPGYSLQNVTARAGWYGGNSADLFDAVNTCYVAYMRGAPLQRDSARSRALYEYLASLGQEPGPALPLSLVANVTDVPRGDAALGADVYARACRDCHGALHSGAGRNTARAPVLPEVAAEYPALFPGTAAAVVVVEKVRHGQFFGVGGNMPLYSLEALSDDQLGALLAHLGL